jgi:hypothetical protein
VDALFWTMVVTGVVLVALGLVAIVPGVQGIPRRDGWPPLGMGVSAILMGVARYRDLPGEDWVSWVVVAIIFGVLLLQWRTHRRRRSSV